MKNKYVQLIQVTPEELQDAIVEGVKNQLQELKTHFQPKTPPEYLTRNQVSELLQINLSTLHNWVKKGKLKPYGISGRVYFKRSEVEAAIIAI